MRKWEVTFDNVPPPDGREEFRIIDLDPKSEEFTKISDYFYIHMPKLVKVTGLVAKIGKKI